MKKNYHIYGRESFPEPLSFQRTIAAIDPEDLEKALAGIREDRVWVELIAFPEDAIVCVISNGEVQ